MTDKHLLEQMEATLKRLSVPVDVTESEAADSLPEEVREALRDMTEGLPQEIGGAYYMPVKQPAVILSCESRKPGARDLLVLAGALIASMATGEHMTENSFDVYRRVLRGELMGAELEALCHEHQLPQNLERCAMVFHMVQTGEERA